MITCIKCPVDSCQVLPGPHVVPKTRSIYRSSAASGLRKWCTVTHDKKWPVFLISSHELSSCLLVRRPQHWSPHTIGTTSHPPCVQYSMIPTSPVCVTFPLLSPQQCRNLVMSSAILYILLFILRSQTCLPSGPTHLCHALSLNVLIVAHRRA